MPNEGSRLSLRRLVTDLAHAVVLICHGGGGGGVHQRTTTTNTNTNTNTKKSAADCHPDVVRSTTTLYLNADNYAVVYLNGKRVATTDSDPNVTAPATYYGWQKTTAVVVADWPRCGGGRNNNNNKNDHDHDEHEYEIVIVCENASGSPSPAGIVVTLVTTHYDARKQIIAALTTKHDSTGSDLGYKGGVFSGGGGGLLGDGVWVCTTLTSPTDYPHTFGPKLCAADVPGYDPKTLVWGQPMNQGPILANTTWDSSPAVFDVAHFDTTPTKPAQWVWNSYTCAGNGLAAPACATVAFKFKGTTASP